VQKLCIFLFGFCLHKHSFCSGGKAKAEGSKAKKENLPLVLRRKVALALRFFFAKRRSEERAREEASKNLKIKGYIFYRIKFNSKKQLY
jgi:hypothetical protein